MSNDLIIIKAFGKAAEAKLKALIALPRSVAAQLPHKTVSKVNRIAAELIEGSTLDADYQGRGTQYVPKRVKAAEC